MKVKVFNHYFDKVVEYPDPVAVMMRPGTLLAYISSSFLNGWINYVEPVRAFLLTRYCKHVENVAFLTAWHDKPPHHARFGILRDDVLVLARDKQGMWWFFWGDRDTSDCEIGRFDTQDNEAAVVSSFEHYAKEQSIVLSRDLGPALPIDVKSIRGWISF